MSAKSNKISLTKTELEVLKVIWSIEQGSIKEIIEAFSPKKNYAYTTIQTILKHLQEKKAVDVKKIYNTNVFYPIVDEGEIKHSLVKSLLAEMFQNDPRELVASLVENDFIGEQELLELHKQFVEVSKSE